MSDRDDRILQAIDEAAKRQQQQGGSGGGGSSGGGSSGGNSGSNNQQQKNNRQQQQKRPANPWATAGKRAGILIFMLEVFWVFLTLLAVLEPSTQGADAPEWWREGTFLFIPIWGAVVLVIATLLQFVLTYTPLVMRHSAHYLDFRYLLLFVNRMFNFTGFYVLMSMLGMISNLDTIREYITKTLTVGDVIWLLVIMAVSTFTVKLSEAVEDVTK